MWGDGSPLGTDPGRGLAAELADAATGEQALDIAKGAVHGLHDLPHEAPVAELERVYLRGLAAAAVLADHGAPVRVHTRARDYALRGAQVEFLPGVTVRMGVLSVALAAVQRSWWIRADLRAAGIAVPRGHVEAVRQVTEGLQRRLTERMKGEGRR